MTGGGKSVRVHHRQGGGYTAGQAAIVLGITRRELDRAVKDGRITPTYTPGGQRRFAHDDVDRLRDTIAPLPDEDE